ncbi:hypothetical protein CEXT_289421, partial [Caerostris extrusa]
GFPQAIMRLPVVYFFLQKSVSCDFSCTKEHVAGVSRFLRREGFHQTLLLDKICILWQKRVQTRSVESQVLVKDHDSKSEICKRVPSSHYEVADGLLLPPTVSGVTSVAQRNTTYSFINKGLRGKL